jgi:hypothetical protein
MTFGRRDITGTELLEQVFAAGDDLGVGLRHLVSVGKDCHRVPNVATDD